MRLKAIAVDRAPTIARVIQRICIALGRPWAASTAPRKAKGSANRVCSILIISSVVPMFFRIIKGPGRISDFLHLLLGEGRGKGGWIASPSPNPHPKREGAVKMLNAHLIRFTFPTRTCRMRDRELIQDPEDQMIHQGFDRLRPMIETRTRR